MKTALFYREKKSARGLKVFWKLQWKKTIKVLDYNYCLDTETLNYNNYTDTETLKMEKLKNTHTKTTKLY